MALWSWVSSQLFLGLTTNWEYSYFIQATIFYHFPWRFQKKNVLGDTWKMIMIIVTEKLMFLLKVFECITIASVCFCTYICNKDTLKLMMMCNKNAHCLFLRDSRSCLLTIIMIQMVSRRQGDTCTKARREKWKIWTPRIIVKIKLCAHDTIFYRHSVFFFFFRV